MSPPFRDNSSPIAMAGEDSTGSPINRQIPDSLVFWRAGLYQPYCRLHFLRECSLYHLRSTSHFKVMIERLPNPTKASKWPAAPTRVQPARRAREKGRKDQSEQAARSRTSSPVGASKSKDPRAAFEALRELFQHHLPWPLYKTRLEDRIVQISERLHHHSEGDDSESHSNCSYKWRMECRYCTFKSEVVDGPASVPRKLAEPAPMHSIHSDHMREEQIGEFGGLKFAVDVCGGRETIVLLGMKKIDDLALVGEQVAESGITSLGKTIISRKRKSPSPITKSDGDCNRR